MKNVMASLRCHSDSDCNKTQIIRNFHIVIQYSCGNLFSICLLMPTQLTLKPRRYPPKRIQSSHLDKVHNTKRKAEPVIIGELRAEQSHSQPIFVLSHNTPPHNTPPQGRGVQSDNSINGVQETKNGVTYRGSLATQDRNPITSIWKAIMRV